MRIYIYLLFNSLLLISCNIGERKESEISATVITKEILDNKSDLVISCKLLNSQIDSLLSINQPLRALKKSQLLEVQSKILGNLYPTIRIKSIEKFVELSYNYDLTKTIIYDMEEKLNEAISILETHPKLIPRSKKIYYWRGIVAFGKRNYTEGVNSLMTAIDLNQKEKTINLDTAFIVRCYTQIATLYKGSKSYVAADSIFKTALKYSECLSEHSIEKQLLLQDLTTFNIAKKDSGNTFKFIERIAKLPPEKRIISTNRLKGLWYYKVGEYDKSIKAYSLVENEMDSISAYFQRYELFHECTWQLSLMYLKIKKFDLSIHYLTKYLLVELLPDLESNYSWNDVLDNTKYFEVDSRDFMLYGVYADVLQAKADNIQEPALKNAVIIQSINVLQYTDSLMHSYTLMNQEEVAINLIQEFANKYYPNAINLCYELYQQTKNDRLIGKANYFMERLKSFSLSKDLNKKIAFDKTENLLVFNLFNIENKQKNIKWKLKNNNIEKHRLELSFLQQRQQGIVDSLKTFYPKIFNDVMQSSYFPQQVISHFFSKNVSSKFAFLQFTLTKDYLFLILNQKGHKYFFRKELSDDIMRDISLYKNYLRKIPQSEKDNDRFTLLSKKMYEVLFGKNLQKLIPLNTQLVIIPDNITFDLPLESLTDNNGNYLIKSYYFQNSFSLKTFLSDYEDQNRFNRDSKILGISFTAKEASQNRFFAFLRGENFGELKGAAKEVAFISDLFSNTKNQFYYGNECSKETFLSAIEQPFDIVHLALHASLNSYSQSDICLIFKNEMSTQKISRLSITEIENLDIKAPLVVLSACSTNQGEIVAGEGVYSLARAFKKAGANSLIATLWEVEDEFTSQIMQYFYQYLELGVLPSIALGKAKRNYLDKSDQLTSHPFFWSGIISLN